jgi:hypothetical protein
VDVARRAWQRIETLHAVVYFAPEPRDAAVRAGLRGFWMGYFALRAAPLGPVGADAVTDAFWSFAPRMVERAIPDAWTRAAPEELVRLRREASARTLLRLTPDVTTTAEAVVRRAGAVVRRVPDDRAAFPLGASNAALAAPEDPVEHLWQVCTTVREHRGDAHVRALRDAQLAGPDPHVLFAATEGVPAETLRDNRGWSDTEWDAGRDRLVARGLLAPGGSPTDEGRAVRDRVEAQTDAASRHLLGDDVEWIVDRLDPPARAIAASGAIPYPNPMGLPPLA